jgi:hypothetical protein
VSARSVGTDPQVQGEPRAQGTANSKHSTAYRAPRPAVAWCAGAELQNVVNEGALLAARRNADHVGLADLLEGVDRTRNGVNARPASLGGLAARVRKLLGPPKGLHAARASPLF